MSHQIDYFFPSGRRREHPDSPHRPLSVPVRRLFSTKLLMPYSIRRSATHSLLVPAANNPVLERPPLKTSRDSEYEAVCVLQHPWAGTRRGKAQTMTQWTSSHATLCPLYRHPRASTRDPKYGVPAKLVLFHFTLSSLSDLSFLSQHLPLCILCDASSFSVNSISA